MGSPKGQLQLDGRSLLEHAVDALAFVDAAVLVSPEAVLRPRADWPPVRFTLEEPVLGGPVAGIAAGVSALGAAPDDEVTYLLPCDLPTPGRVVKMLRFEPIAGDGVVLQDKDDWPQFLLGKYRLGPLRERIQKLGVVRDVSVRRFALPLNLRKIPVAGELVADVDTPEQARIAGIELTDGAAD